MSEVKTSIIMSNQSTITNNYLHFTYPQIFTFRLHTAVKENKRVSTLHAQAQYEKCSLFIKTAKIGLVNWAQLD